MLVVLVDKRRMRRGAITWFANERLELAHVRHDEHRAGVLWVTGQVDAEAVPEGLQPVGHHPCGSEYLVSLLFARRAGVDFAACFTVGAEQVEAARRHADRLAVF